MIGHRFRATFGHVVAVIYTAGTVFHVVRVIIRLELAGMPFLPDWILVVLGSYGAAGLVRFAGEVVYRGRWEVVIHWLIVCHMLVSVALHAWILAVGSHDVLSVFSIEYSYFGAAYFGFFAWRSWTMRLDPVRESAA